jgi:hypothetical protein
VGTIAVRQASWTTWSKEEETETGILAPGEGTTEADSSANQRAAKEMIDSKIDTEL